MTHTALPRQLKTKIQQLETENTVKDYVELGIQLETENTVKDYVELGMQLINCTL